MTLKELIKVRKNKFDEQKQAACADSWKGYMSGWYWAYQDLEEIFEQNGFDTSIVVIPDVSNHVVRETKLRLCGTEYKYCDGDCKNCNETEYHATNKIEIDNPELLKGDVENG